MENPHGIKIGDRYYVLMRPCHVIPFIGWGFTSSNDQEEWVECEVVEENYRIEDGYKIELRALNELYGKETFYQDDFLSMAGSERIIVKKQKSMYVEHVVWLEPLCGNVNLVHTASHIASL